jgi:RimJ/RimL family protein N-acetyltransferase
VKTYLLKKSHALIVRRGTPDDAANFVRYIDVCAGQSDFLTFNKGEFSTVEAQRCSIAELSDSRNGLFLIAEIGGKIIGNLTFRLGKRSKNWHVGEFGITVHKDYWGLGVGRVLIRSLIEWARKMGHVRKINLKVRVDNQRGLELYKKIGFSQEGLLKREVYSNGIFYDAIIMGLCVDPK